MCVCVCVVVLVYVCASLVGIGSNHLFDVEGHQLDVRQCLPIRSPSRSLCVSLTTCTPLWKTCTWIHDEHIWLQILKVYVFRTTFAFVHYTSAYMHTRPCCVCAFDWMCFLSRTWLRLQYIVGDLGTVKGPLQYLEHLRHKRSFHLLLRVSWIIDWASGCTVLSHRLWVVCIWSLIIGFPTFSVSCAPPAPSDELMDTFMDTDIYLHLFKLFLNNKPSYVTNYSLAAFSCIFIHHF